MPGKIYDLSDLDNFELPPLPSTVKKTQPASAAVNTQSVSPDSGVNAAEANAESGGSIPVSPETDLVLPPLPAKKPEPSDAAAPVQADNANTPAAGDFDLPPLPARKPSAAQSEVPENLTEENVQTENVSADNISEDDFALPPLPVRKPAGTANENAEAAADEPEVQPSVESAAFQDSGDGADDFALPPLHVKKAEGTADTANPSVSEEPSDGFDLPPLPERKPEETSENDQTDFTEDREAYEEPVYEESQPEQAEEYISEQAEEETKPRISLEDDLDVDLNTVTPADIGIDDPSKALAPMHTAREAQARNVREKMKMEDLAMNMDAPVLDDLSDEYAAPKKRAENLLERDHLESDEKQVLKQRLQEDLSRRPENFNARASRNMYNKLMEEKKLKVAKKGMLLSFIPIVMELIAAGICFFTMNWGSYQWLSYVAAFGAFGALLLLIKSKHTKMFSIIISAVTVLMYVGPGLVLYAIDEGMQADPDYILHIVLAAAAALLNIVSILILTKNESVNIYYTTKFKRK